MTVDHIRRSIEGAVSYLTASPGEGRVTDVAATAVVEEGLRCRAIGPHGAALISDMPRAIGGGGAAPSPGWLLRAALANCDATLIMMRAAQMGVFLDTLEVTVDSESDDRGMLGVGEGVPPGPLSLRTRIRIGADGVPHDQLQGIVAWAVAHSPVADAMRRAVPTTLDVEIDVR